jgi:mannose-6-phosphate isomerase-like protein (cupin superfamily)
MDTSEYTHALLAPGDGEVLEAGGNRLVIKVASASQFVCDYTAPPHFPGPPLHVHPGFDETFVVLEGLLEVTVRGESSTLDPGATAYVGGEVPHTFRNPGGDPVRFLVICSPGGMEHYFRGIANDDVELVAATAERLGYRPVEDDLEGALAGVR